MSLKEDMDVLERYIEAGLGKEYLNGTAPRLKPEPASPDRSAVEKLPDYEWISRRGD